MIVGRAIRIFSRSLWSAAVLCLVAVSPGKAASGYVWHGESNRHGGKVQYSNPPDSPDYDEGTRIEITCYAFDRGIRMVIYSETPDGFEAGEGIVFTFDDGTRVQRPAELAYWGYFGRMPSTWLARDDLEHLMRGSQLEITLENDASGFEFKVDLTGTRSLFSQHLHACSLEAHNASR